MSNREIAIVTGSSGFIGTRLVANLISSGKFSSIRAIDVLPPRAVLAGAEYVVHDVRKAFPVKLGDGVRRIYNLAAVHRTPGHPDNEYYDTNVSGAVNVTRLATECNIEEILFTSSISVYGPSETLMTEVSRLRPTSSYGRSKRISEEIHLNWQLDLPSRRVVVVRPGVVFGPGERGNYTYLARALQRGVFAYPGRRDTVKSGGYVDELIRALDFAFSREEKSIIFNFAYPEESTLESIVESMSRALGTRTRPYPTLPLSVMMAIARCFELLNALGVRNPIHRERIQKLVSSTKIFPGWLQKNGYEFGSDLDEALLNWSQETSKEFT